MIADHADVVEERRALFGGGLDQVDQQPGVVELAVVVDHSAAQAFGPDRRQPRQRLVPREDLRGSEPVLAGQDVVDLQAQPVEGRLPPVVAGHDERQVADQVRSILSKQPALLERLHHQRDVALLEVAHAAVHELGAPARGALAEVVLFEEHDVVSAARGIHGDADTGGTAADDDDVPGRVALVESRQHVVATHA